MKERSVRLSLCVVWKGGALEIEEPKVWGTRTSLATQVSTPSAQKCLSQLQLDTTGR